MNEQGLIDEFIELVKIDSETKHEAEISHNLKQELTNLSLDIFDDGSNETTSRRHGNRYCRLKGNKRSIDTICYTSYLDTVVHGCGIRPTIKDRYITSDGTKILGADDKAGLAAIFETIRTIQENDIQHGDIQFVITAGEESGLVGAKALKPEHIHASYGY